jgi:hypothetical protein
MQSIPKRLISCGMTTKLADILKRSVLKNEEMLKGKIQTLPNSYATSLFFTDCLMKSDPEVFGGLFENSVAVSLDRMRGAPKLSFANVVESVRCKLMRFEWKDKEGE